MATDSAMAVPSSSTSTGLTGAPTRARCSGARCSPFIRSTSITSTPVIPFSARIHATRRGLGARRLV